MLAWFSKQFHSPHGFKEVVPGLQAQFRDAARTAFEELRRTKPDEAVYAFALYTDSDCVATAAAANTEQSLLRKLESLRKLLGAENALAKDDTDALRWGTSEWEYEGIGGAAFPSSQDMMALLVTWTNKHAKSDADFRRGVLAAMVGARKGT